MSRTRSYRKAGGRLPTRHGSVLRQTRVRPGGPGAAEQAGTQAGHLHIKPAGRHRDQVKFARLRLRRSSLGQADNKAGARFMASPLPVRSAHRRAAAFPGIPHQRCLSRTLKKAGWLQPVRVAWRALATCLCLSRQEVAADGSALRRSGAALARPAQRAGAGERADASLGPCPRSKLRTDAKVKDVYKMGKTLGTGGAPPHLESLVDMQAQCQQSLAGPAGFAAPAAAVSQTFCDIMPSISNDMNVWA